MGLRIFPDLLAAPSNSRDILVPDELSGAVRQVSIVELQSRSQRLAAALVEYGLAPGDRGAVLASPGDAGLLAVFGLQSAGATVVPLDAARSNSDLADTMKRAGARFAIADDDTALDRLMRVRPEIDSLEMLLVLRSDTGDRPSPAITLSAAEALGASVLAEDPEVVDRILRRTEGDDVAFLWDGPMTHRALLRNATALQERAAIGNSDVVLLGLPAHVPAHFEALAACISSAGTPALGRGGRFPDAVARECRQCRPTTLLVRSEGIDSTARKYFEERAAAGFVRRKLHAWALEKGIDPPRNPWAYRWADRLVLKQSRMQFGGRLRRVVTFGGPISDEARGLMQSLGFEWVPGSADRPRA